MSEGDPMSTGRAFHLFRAALAALRRGREPRSSDIAQFRRIEELRANLRAAMTRGAGTHEGDGT